MIKLIHKIFSHILYIVRINLLRFEFYQDYYYCKQQFKEYFSTWEYLKFYLSTDKRMYWPKAKTCIVNNQAKIFMGKGSDVCKNSNYIQGHGKLFIGDYVRAARNCTIVSSNHDLYNHQIQNLKETIIGDYCWIGANSCILAGVILGPRTIVGAGSVVTKSFPQGYVVIAGNPAKIIKELDPQKHIKYTNEHEYYGYIPASKFAEFRKKYLSPIDFNFDINLVSNNEFYSSRKDGK